MESIRDGAIDFIVKPFDRERIVGLLNKVRARRAPNRDRGPQAPTSEAVGDHTRATRPAS